MAQDFTETLKQARKVSQQASEYLESRGEDTSIADRIGEVSSGLLTVDPAELISNPSREFSIQQPDSGDTDAVRSARSVLDATPETQLASMEARRQERAEENRQRREELRERRTQLTEEAAQTIRDRPSQEEVIRREREELGVPQELERQRAVLDEIRGLRQQAIDLEQQRGEALATSEGRKAPIGFIRGEQARVQEQFDRRIATVSKLVGAESAVLQASQGMVQQARSLTQDIVKASTFDTEMELKRIGLFMENNKEQISELDTEIQNDLQRTQQHWENRLAEERQDKQTIANLMIEIPSANISIDDTLEEASGKAAIALGIREIEDVALQFAQAGATEAQVKDITSSSSVGEAIAKGARMGLASGGASSSDDLTVELGTPGKRRLAGAGYSSQDVSDIERLVNDTGIRNTLETLFETGSSVEAITAVAQEYEAMDILNEVEQARTPAGEDEQGVFSSTAEQFVRGGKRIANWFKFWE